MKQASQASQAQQAPRALFDSAGFPFLREKPHLLSLVHPTLKPGSKVVQLGQPAKSGKETSSSRIQQFKPPVRYLGLAKVSNIGSPQMVFEYVHGRGRDRKMVYLLYSYFDGAEVYLINYRTHSIRIHKALFKLKKSKPKSKLNKGANTCLRKTRLLK